jgi:hypothetical protein
MGEYSHARLGGTHRFFVRSVIGTTRPTLTPPRSPPATWTTTPTRMPWRRGQTPRSSARGDGGHQRPQLGLWAMDRGEWRESLLQASVAGERSDGQLAVTQWEIWACSPREERDKTPLPLCQMPRSARRTNHGQHRLLPEGPAALLRQTDAETAYLCCWHGRTSQKRSLLRAFEQRRRIHDCPHRRRSPAAWEAGRRDERRRSRRSRRRRTAPGSTPDRPRSRRRRRGDRYRIGARRGGPKSTRTTSRPEPERTAAPHRNPVFSSGASR